MSIPTRSPRSSIAHRSGARPKVWERGAFPDAKPVNPVPAGARSLPIDLRRLYFLQNVTKNNTSTVETSNRPRSITRLSTILAE
jgi:hypothetical protein